MAAFTTPVAKPAPEINIPRSDQTVKVSVIDTTARMDNFPLSMFVTPQIGEHTILRAPAFSFLIENESKGQKVLFDLGVPTAEYPKPVADMVKLANPKIEVEKSVAAILEDNKVSLDSISAVVYSHSHFDHIGDMHLFPPSTTLVVGPDFKKRYVPGYPINPEAPINDNHYTGREVREVTPETDSNGLVIGGYPAVDYFGDGSFYLLFSPGHTKDHLCALARTTAGPETFIFMAGDCVHHGGEHRPTEYLPLPAEIRPNPLENLPQSTTSFCPGEMFLKLHPKHSATEHFYEPNLGENLEESVVSIQKLEDFDAHDNVFCIMAHDPNMLGLIDFFPKPANSWKAKGWRETVMWSFLRSFVDPNANL